MTPAVDETSNDGLQWCVDLEDGTFDIRHDGVVLAHQASMLVEASHDGETLLLHPGRYANRELLAGDGSAESTALLRCRTPRLPDLELHAAWPASTNELQLVMTVRNTTGTRFTITEMRPFVLAAAGSSLHLPDGTPPELLYRLGYQSWSPSGCVALGDPPSPVRFRTPGLMSDHPPRAAGNGSIDVTSYWMALYLSRKERNGVLLGFLDPTRCRCGVDHRVSSAVPARLSAWCDWEQYGLEPGESLSTPPLVVAAGTEPWTMLKRYTEAVAGACGPVPAPVPIRGWCSWYAYYQRITSADILANAEELKRHEVTSTFSYVLLDDGYEAEVGDWRQCRTGFGAGLDSVFYRLRERGFKPGLWLAPFLATPRSRLFKEHSEWFLTGHSHQPVKAGYNPLWRSRVYALDATHPEYLDWLSEFISYCAHDLGVALFKLDFLYAAALDGRRYESRMTGISALRRALERIRAAAGDALLIGCGCPFGAAVGVVDAMRIGVDTSRTWRHSLADGIVRLPVTPSLANNLRGSLTRLVLNNRWWSNDPDCLYMSGLDESHMQTMLTAAAVTAGVLTISDRLPAEEEALDRLHKTMPHPSRRFECRDLHNTDAPSCFWLPDRRGGLLVLFERTDAVVHSIDHELLPGAADYHVYDFWNNTVLGTGEGLGAFHIPHGGCRVLRLTAADSEPRLIGTDLHLLCGIEGIEETWSRRAAVLTLAITLPGTRRGHLWITAEQTTAVGIETRDCRVAEPVRLGCYLRLSGEFHEGSRVLVKFNHSGGTH
ncbi:alpha-galactosidase [bacterium]|nr:alpha-galactosidase [candidate division CSSED10-310 bacterium]